MIRRLGQITWVITALYWLTLFILTHLPPRDLPQTQVSDKLVHFSVFALLGTMLSASCRLSRLPARIPAILVPAIVLVYAAFDELTQPLVGRTCDVRDWCADAAGAIGAVLVCSAIFALLDRRRGAVPVS